MGTEGIPSDSTRVKITEMFARLGKSQHTEVQPAKITTDDIRNAMRRLGEQNGESVVRTEGDMKFIAEQTEKLKEALAKGDLSLIVELLQEGQNLEGKIKPAPMPKPKIGGGIDGLEVKPVPMPEPKNGNTFGVDVIPVENINDLTPPEVKIIPVSQLPTEIQRGPFTKDRPEIEFY